MASRSAEQAESIAGAAFLTVPAFDGFVWILDSYARLELLVKLHEQLPTFLISPATMLVSMAIGLWLLNLAHKAQLRRLLNTASSQIVNGRGDRIIREESNAWLKSVLIMFLIALIATPLIAVAYSLAYVGTAPAHKPVRPPEFAYRLTPLPADKTPNQKTPTYKVTNPVGSIINQGSPNYGSQTVNVDTPRRLNAQQSAAITAVAQNECVNMPEIAVTASNSNNEAQVYASDIIAALRRGGCMAELRLPIPGLKPDVVGVYVAVRDTKNVPPAAYAILRMLAGLNPKAGKLEPSFLPEETIVLVIGTKE